MSQTSFILRLDRDARTHIKNCRAIYRNEHPELDKIRLSNNKILHEVMKFYIETYNKNYDIEKGEY